MSRLRAEYAAAHTYVETITPTGKVKEKYLIDLGAATSCIPLSAFTKVCLKLELNPSEAKLRGVSGHPLQLEGEGPFHMPMPGTDTPFRHDLQVIFDNSMPTNVRILGIDFWHRVKAKVDVANQKVTGTTPNGEQFTMDFEITNCKPRSDINAVLAYQPQGGTEDPDSDIPHR